MREIVSVATRHRLKTFVLVQIVVLALWHRRWWKGMMSTIVSIVRFHVETGGKGIPIETETFECTDGEACCVWHVRRRDRSDNVWIVLPGGMTHGNKFYTHDALRSGIFGDEDDVLIFHNPGIANKVKRKAPAALTDSTYLEEYVRNLKRKDPNKKISLIGFSAGGMLAISATARFEKDAKTSSYLRRTIAVHCPDRIRDVFETHQKGWIRLDRAFALSLLLTMIRSGSSTVLSRKRGGGFGRDPWVLPTCLYFGWDWMKRFTEGVFQRSWYKMERDLWSCREAMTKKLHTPLLRIISRNDPIVCSRSCVDPALFDNIDKVIVQNDGGHCAAFRDERVRDATIKWCRSH